ncbi:hypothetical protein TIFTF001_028629 [Ficus carica]|uniref:Uncharacterized protein n=1 Tax=Ficus carica TaxID=3494 RepID=A0AA88DQ37_FICCA|nr:hypothetical protein TIFTF001_028629 [Ficus carica]
MVEMVKLDEGCRRREGRRDGRSNVKLGGSRRIVLVGLGDDLARRSFRSNGGAAKTGMDQRRMAMGGARRKREERWWWWW